MPSYKYLHPEQRQAVVEAYEDHQNTSVVALKLGLPLRTVQHLLKGAGYVLTSKRIGACEKHETELREWAAEGLPLSEMARRIGTKHQRVHAFLHERAIPHREYRGGGQPGEWNASWKGGRMIDKDGYVLLLRPDHPQANRHGYVREHRLVMEKRMGRYLTSSEVVHHVDGNRQNNSDQNLALFDSNGSHLATTRKGIAPAISAEGRDRIRESSRQRSIARQASNHPLLRGDDGRWQAQIDQSGASRDRVSQLP